MVTNLPQITAHQTVTQQAVMIQMVVSRHRSQVETAMAMLQAKSLVTATRQVHQNQVSLSLTTVQ